MSVKRVILAVLVLAAMGLAPVGARQVVHADGLQPCFSC